VVLMLTDDTARPQLLWSAGATAAVLLVAGGRELRDRRRRTREAAGPVSPAVAIDADSGTHGDDHV
jgi:aromatic amino acid permease